MGVKDGDNLIVTTEMKLPLDQLSSGDDMNDMPQPNNGTLDDIMDMSTTPPPYPMMGDYGRQPLLREGEMRMGGGDPYSNSVKTGAYGHHPMGMGAMHGQMHGMHGSMMGSQ